MKIIDPGHKYLLQTIDGDEPQLLMFVKRCDLIDPKRYPGNKDSYPGTTLQNVIRALLNRMRYLQGQIWCFENSIIIFSLRLALWLLENRAARRHGHRFWKSLSFAESKPMCTICGHVICDHPQS